MSSNRRSVLQCQILLQLKVGAVKQITELARLIDAERSSVSRSLSTLQTQGLVIQTDNGWELTDAGNEEVDAVRVVIADTPKKLNDKVKEFARIAQLAGAIPSSAIPPEMFIPKSIQSLMSLPPDALNMHWQSHQNLQGIDLLKGVRADFVQYKPDFSSLNALNQMHQSAVVPLLDAQERIASLWKQLIPKVDASVLQSLLTPTNRAVASLVENTFAISQLPNFQAALQSTSTASQLAKSLINVTRSYQLLVSDYVREDNLRNQDITVQSAQQVVLPSVSVAQYTQVVRSVYDEQFHLSSIEDGAPDAYENDFLDSLLNKVNPQFVTMRRGSWGAIRSQGPDYLRHAGVSQRELLSQLLSYLVPNEELPEDQRKGPQIKARLRKLGATRSEVEHTNIMARAALSHYELLNGYTHGNKEDEIACRIMLQIGENLITFILTRYFKTRDGKEDDLTV